MKVRFICGLAAILIALTACQQSNSKTSNNDSNRESLLKQRQLAENPRAIDFTLNDMDGIPVEAKDEFAKHKITIIDFWASWCPPCRQEMPNLVELYNNYKDKGLGIIGVSLDEDKSQWEKAVKTFGMTWTQVSDLQGWDNAVALQYSVRSIPFTMIVDSKGYLLVMSLRGEALADFVKNYLR